MMSEFISFDWLRALRYLADAGIVIWTLRASFSFVCAFLILGGSEMQKHTEDPEWIKNREIGLGLMKKASRRAAGLICLVVLRVALGCIVLH